VANFFGIDVGSSFIKGAILDLDALELRHTGRVPFPEFVSGLPPLHREASPAAIITAAERVLAILSAEKPDCEGLVLCGQMHGFVLVDRLGQPVSNYISWLDQRISATEFEELAAQVTAEERREIGNEFRPGIALPLLYWLKRHGALPEGDVMPISIADFVAAQLCGIQPVMEPTQAAAFGALRLGSTRWHEQVIGKLGLASLDWPEVRPSGSIVGAWRGVPCFTAVGDQQCALAGALLGERELSVNIGTGSQVAMIADSVPSDGLQTRPYFDNRFLRTITHIPGGRALSALVRLLTELGRVTEADAWRDIQSAVATVPSTDVRAGIAFFPGPCGDRGFIENLHEGNLDIGHLFRAVFQSMAGNYESCARRLDPSGDAGRIVFSGGVARQLETVRELTAAALGLPYRLSPHPEDTLFGLMVLALAFSGRQDSVRAATDVARRHLAVSG
jgi:sugar (pentulose or hexulose) kinase